MFLQKIKRYFFILLLIASSCSHKNDNSNVNKILPMDTYTLKNGLAVTLVPQKDTQFATILTVYDVGGNNEKEPNLGLSHLLEHMMFKTTKNLATGEFNKIIEKELGGQFNAMTTYDSTIYYLNVPSYGIERSLFLEAERMQNLIIESDAFTKEKQVVLEEMRNRIENSDFGFLIDRVNKIYFKDGNYPYGRDLGGLKNIIPILPETLQKYYEKYYAPNNAHLVIVGNFDTVKTQKAINKYYGGISSRPVPKFTVKDFKPAVGSFEIKRKTKNNYTMFLTKIPPATDPLIKSLMVLSDLLTDSNSSILNDKLVKTGLSSFVESFCDLAKMPSSMNILVSAYDNKNVPQILETIKKALVELKNDPLLAERLQKHHLKKITNTYISLQNSNNIAMDIAQGWVLGKNPKFYLNLKIKPLSQKELLKAIDFLLASEWATFTINKSL